MNAILRLSLPLTLWLAAFSAVYGLHGLLCSSRWAAFVPELPGRALLAGAALVAVALQIALLAVLRSSRWPRPSVAIAASAWCLPRLPWSVRLGRSCRYWQRRIACNVDPFCNSLGNEPAVRPICYGNVFLLLAAKCRIRSSYRSCQQN